MSKAFTFDLESVEIVNKSKSEEVEPKVREGKLDELVKDLERKLFKIIECDEFKDMHERVRLTYDASVLYYQIMDEANLLSRYNGKREIAINLAGLYFSVDFGVMKSFDWFLVAPNGSLFKVIIDQIAEPTVINFAYILKEKVVKRPPPVYG